jgi:hypothetical protein
MVTLQLLIAQASQPSTSQPSPSPFGSPVVVAAIVAATATIFGAVAGYLASRRNQRSLEGHQRALQAETASLQREIEHVRATLSASVQREIENVRATLAEEKSERDARRDYVYDARKRLYQEYEPLLFRLLELSENALHRARSLARSARQGNLGTTQHWLDKDEYYLRSTAYNLLAPLVIFRLIQRRLTLVDLSLDKAIYAYYQCAKAVYIIFTDDYKLAQWKGQAEDWSTPYDPTAPNAGRLPEQWGRRQGMVIGLLDNALDAMVVEPQGGPPRCMTFGEFDTAADHPTTGPVLAPLLGLFLKFHPRKRPILWRILVAQAHVYSAMLRARDRRISDESPDVVPVIEPFAYRKELDWREPQSGVSDADFEAPFRLAIDYLAAAFPALTIRGNEAP